MKACLVEGSVHLFVSYRLQKVISTRGKCAGGYKSVHSMMHSDFPYFKPQVKLLHCMWPGDMDTLHQLTDFTATSYMSALRVHRLCWPPSCSLSFVKWKTAPPNIDRQLSMMNGVLIIHFVTVQNKLAKESSSNENLRPLTQTHNLYNN